MRALDRFHGRDARGWVLPWFRLRPVALIALVAALMWSLTLPPGPHGARPAAAVPMTVAPGANGAFASVNTGFNNVVTSLTVMNGTLYAGGFFDAPGGNNFITSTPTSGGPWSPLSTGMGPADLPGFAFVKSLAHGNDTVFAGGTFSNASGVPGTCNISSWSGIAWASMGSLEGTPSPPGSLPPCTNTNGPPEALAFLNGTLYASGYFTQIGGANANYVAAWDGSSWHPFTSQLADGSYLTELAASDSTLYAAGPSPTRLLQYPITNPSRPWEGSSWTALTPGLDTSPSSTINGLATHGETLYVGGTLYPSGGTSAMRYVAAHTSTGWRALGDGLPSAVTALAVDSEHGLLYAGGKFPQSTGSDLRYLAQAWDDGISSWIPLDGDPSTWQFDVGNIYGGAFAFAVDGAAVFIGGSFTFGDTDGIVRWTWAPPSGSNAASGSSGQNVTITGSQFIGMPTTGAVSFGSTPVTYTRTSTTSITATVPNCLSSGSYPINVDAVGGEASVGTISITYRDDVCNPRPAPQPSPSATPNVTPTATPAQAPTLTVAPPATVVEVAPGASTMLIGGVPAPVTRSPITPAGGFSMSGGGVLVDAVPPPTGFSSGGSSSVVMSGYAPDSSVGAFLFSDPVSLGTLPVGSDGSARGKIVIPANISPGQHTLQFTGWNASGEPVVLSAGITVKPQVKRVVQAVPFKQGSATLNAAGRAAVVRAVSSSAALAGSVRTTVSYVDAGTSSMAKLAKSRAQVVARALAVRGLRASITPVRSSAATRAGLRPSTVVITSTG